MPVFNDGSNNLFQTEGSRIVWSSTRRPALLMPNQAVTLNNFDIAFPDFSKSNAYGFTYGTDGLGFQVSSCVSLISIDPQEWDSGQSFVCNLPAGANYFETEITISRITTPSPYLETPIPDIFGSGRRHMSDGNSAIVEALGPIIRMFAFERSGNTVQLRRKQSVTGAGDRVGWNSPNDNNTGAGGYRPGWTYGGNRFAWPAYRVDARAGGNIAKRRGEVNQCTLTDPSNYASLWRGTIIVTPGYVSD